MFRAQPIRTAVGGRLAPWRTHWCLTSNAWGRVAIWARGVYAKPGAFVNLAAVCSGRRLLDTDVVRLFALAAAQCSSSVPRQRRLREAACLASLVTSHPSPISTRRIRLPPFLPLECSNAIEQALDKPLLEVMITLSVFPDDYVSRAKPGADRAVCLGATQESFGLASASASIVEGAAGAFKCARLRL
jgi:hypothetical protein